jgi:hypothetical protein
MYRLWKLTNNQSIVELPPYGDEGTAAMTALTPTFTLLDALAVKGLEKLIKNEAKAVDLLFRPRLLATKDVSVVCTWERERWRGKRGGDPASARTSVLRFCFLFFHQQINTLLST